MTGSCQMGSALCCLQFSLWNVTFFCYLPCPSTRNYCFMAKPVIKIASSEGFQDADNDVFMVRCLNLKWLRRIYLFSYSCFLGWVACSSGDSSGDIWSYGRNVFQNFCIMPVRKMCLIQCLLVLSTVSTVFYFKKCL